MSIDFQHLHTVTADRVLNVNSIADLPVSAAEGSVRYVKENTTFYGFDGVAWSAFSGPGVGAAYTTIQTDFGSFPIATVAGETLTLTSSDDSLSITGTASTDTVDLKALSSEVSSTLIRVFDCDVGALAGDIVYQDATTPNKVNVNTDNTNVQPSIGVIRQKLTGTTCEVLILGIQDGFSSLLLGRTVYLSTSGVPTQSKPVTGYIQNLGTAVSSTEIFFTPNSQRIVQV